METLPGLLREWRTARDLSLGALALKAGVSKATLSRWEAGVCQPNIPELEAVLDALCAAPEQRFRALSLLAAPRAVRRVRELAGGIPEGPPVAGDLLRAMRLRRGLSSEQAAALIGVESSTVSRWERSEAWPAPDRLHALCFALGAREEEVAALSCGVFRPPDEREEPPVEHLPELAKETYRRALSGQGWLMDLEFLTLLRKAWLPALRHAVGRRARADILASYAASLEALGRSAEARQYSWAVLETARQAPRGLRPGLGGIEAALACVGGSDPSRLTRPAAVQQAVKLNEEWLSFSQEPLWEFFRWRQMAGYLAAGPCPDSDAADEAARRALSAAERMGTGPYYRMGSMTRALVLLRTGRAREAIACLTPPADKVTVSAFGETALWTEVLTAAGEREEAHTWLNRLSALADRLDYPHLRRRVDRLAEQHQERGGQG